MNDKVQKIIQGIDKLKTIPKEQRIATVAMLKDEYEILRSNILGLKGGAKTPAQRAEEAAQIARRRAEAAEVRRAAAAEARRVRLAAIEADRVKIRVEADKARTARLAERQAELDRRRLQSAEARRIRLSKDKSDRIHRAVETLGVRIQECIENINENDSIFKRKLQLVAISLESIDTIISSP